MRDAASVLVGRYEALSLGSRTRPGMRRQAGMTVRKGIWKGVDGKQMKSLRRREMKDFRA